MWSVWVYEYQGRLGYRTGFKCYTHKKIIKPQSEIYEVQAFSLDVISP